MARYAYRVGDHHAGVQTNDPRVARRLEARLDDHRIDDPRAPANVSIYGDPDRPDSRSVHRVYRGCDHVFTTRSADRAVAVAAGLLESFLPPRVTSSDVLELRASAVVDDRFAVLAPRALLVRSPALERRLHRTGATVVEHTDVLVDVTGVKVLVPASRLLPEDPDDRGRTVPGPRELAGWFLDRPEDGSPPTRAHAAVHALRLARPQPPDRERFELVTRLLRGLPIAYPEPDAFEDELRRRFRRDRER